MQRCKQGMGAVRYSLYAVFGGSAALVKLVSVIEFILTGGVGEVGH